MPELSADPACAERSVTAQRSRALWLLWAGASAGLALAIGTLATPAAPSLASALPAGAVARVNGVLILRADYDAELARIREREHRAPTAADKRAAVQRLIDDELMIERGLALGMVRGDAPTRRALLGAVFASERASAPARPPSPEDLERFYREAATQLEQPGELRLEQLTFPVLNREQSAAARASAEEAVRRLRAGESVAQVRAALASALEPDRLPDRPLSVDELRELLGPMTLAAALQLEPGEVSDVLGTGSLLRVLVLVDRGEPQLPPLQQIRARVQRMYEQRAADLAFAARVAELRKAADIRVAEQLP